MCTLLLAIDQIPGFPVVIAHNRDEFFTRTFAPAHFWRAAPHILAGIDHKEGGTWLGLSQRGRFAAITNYRDPKAYDPKKKSRGKLVKEFLWKDDVPLDNFIKDMAQKRLDYNPFNLILSENLRDFFWYGSVHNTGTPITPGVHVLSNANMDDPWPKVVRLKSLFLDECTGIAALTAEALSTKLLKLLADQKLASPQEHPMTGLSPAQELAVSSICVATKDYGTVISTVTLVEQSGQITLRELSFSTNHELKTDQVFKLQCLR